MRPINSLRQSNRGESLVLVTIFSTIVIGIVVTMTVISAMLLSKAGSEKSHNQAYEIATSLSARVEELILNGVEGVEGSKSQIDLDKYVSSDPDPESNKDIIMYKGIILETPEGFFEGIPDASASVVVTAIHYKTNPNVVDHYILTVTATAAKETYIKTTEYSGNASSGYIKR